MDKNKTVIKFEDKLKVEGINFKGFGILPKYVMLDKDLSLESKAIYAYFCSFAGSGNTAFPSRDKILDDLCISKDSYYNHLKLLINQGYITVSQQKKECIFSKNIYTLISNPKKFKDDPVDLKDKDIYSKIKFSGIKSQGYGIIPKAVMIDKRLKIKAKGIYAYFCSLTGGNDSIFPNLKDILYRLNVSKNSYYKYYNNLISLNYITVKQRHIRGRLSVNDYYMNDTPDETKVLKKPVIIAKLQFLKNQDTEQNTDIKGKLQFPKNQDTEKQNTKKQDTKKQLPKNQDINNNSINNISINQSSYSNKYIARKIKNSKDKDDSSIDDNINIPKDYADKKESNRTLPIQNKAYKEFMQKMLSESRREYSKFSAEIKKYPDEEYKNDERIEFFADACKNEFSFEQIELLLNYILKILPYPTDDLERYHYLELKHLIMNTRKPTKSRFGYIQKLLKEGIGLSTVF